MAAKTNGIETQGYARKPMTMGPTMRPTQAPTIISLQEKRRETMAGKSSMRCNTNRISILRGGCRFGAPTSRTALEHVAVMQQAV